MITSSIHQLLAENNPLIALIADGLHWNEEMKEYEIWVGGEAVAWAGDYTTAERSYFEMLRAEREHRQRNPANAIPFDGSPPNDSSDESTEAARLGLPVEW